MSYGGYNRNSLQHNPSVSSHHSHRTSYQAPPPPGRPPAGYGGGYAPSGPPAGADPQLWQWFSSVDADRSGAISVTELQSALVNGAYDMKPYVAKIATDARRLSLCRQLVEYVASRYL